MRDKIHVEGKVRLHTAKAGGKTVRVTVSFYPLINMCGAGGATFSKTARNWSWPVSTGYVQAYHKFRTRHPAISGTA